MYRFSERPFSCTPVESTMFTGMLVLSLTWTVETGEPVTVFLFYWTVSRNKSSASWKPASFLLLKRCINIFEKLWGLLFHLETKINFVTWISVWICKTPHGNWGMFFCNVRVFILHFRNFGTCIDTCLLTLRNKCPVVVKIWLCPVR